LKKNNNIKKISNYAMVGGLGAILVSGLVGCEDKSNNQQGFQQSDAFASASQKQAALWLLKNQEMVDMQLLMNFLHLKQLLF
jgi:hypothetical protein